MTVRTNWAEGSTLRFLANEERSAYRFSGKGLSGPLEILRGGCRFTSIKLRYSDASRHPFPHSLIPGVNVRTAVDVLLKKCKQKSLCSVLLTSELSFQA